MMSIYMSMYYSSVNKQLCALLSDKKESTIALKNLSLFWICSPFLKNFSLFLALHKSYSIRILLSVYQSDREEDKPNEEYDQSLNLVFLIEEEAWESDFDSSGGQSTVRMAELYPVLVLFVRGQGLVSFD